MGLINWVDQPTWGTSNKLVLHTDLLNQSQPTSTQQHSKQIKYERLPYTDQKLSKQGSANNNANNHQSEGTPKELVSSACVS